MIGRNRSNRCSVGERWSVAHAAKVPAARCRVLCRRLRRRNWADVEMAVVRRSVFMVHSRRRRPLVVVVVALTNVRQRWQMAVTNCHGRFLKDLAVNPMTGYGAMLPSCGECPPAIGIRPKHIFDA